MTAATPMAPANDGPGIVRALRFGNGDHVELARALLVAVPSDAPAVTDLGALHTYDKRTGVWSAQEPEALARIVHTFSGRAIVADEDSKPRKLKIRRTDVDGIITTAQREAHRKEFFADAPAGFAFSNGFARPTKAGIVLEAHAPEHRARFAYPFAYDPKAPRAGWLAILRDVFRDDADAQQKIDLLQEFAGACLFGVAPKYQRSIFMHGDGANGKSLVAKIIAAGLPKGSVCAVEPQTWGLEYRKALLAGKLLNMVNELPEADILNGDDFKNIVSGEPATARQPCLQAYTFTPTAGHLFAANKLPGSNDQSHGFWRRIITISFHRIFAEHEQDPELYEKIIATELPGIIAWMVDGAVRLMRAGHYTVPASAEETVKTWRREADAVATFVEERTVPATHDNERVSSAELFTAYREWAERGGFKSKNRNNFGRAMTRLGVGAQHTETGGVYPVRMLRVGEPNPRDVERAMAEAARREGAGAAPAAPVNGARPAFDWTTPAPADDG